MKSRQWAIIKTQVEGIHRFPEATDEEKYLSYPHRHIFHITVYIEQFHGDRDIEYIVFKKISFSNLPERRYWYYELRANCRTYSI